MIKLTSCTSGRVIYVNTLNILYISTKDGEARIVMRDNIILHVQEPIEEVARLLND